MKAGFIGLGHLGKAIAKRLISEGVSLTVWNRTKEKAADLGVPVADTPAALVSATDIVFLNLFDSEAVWSVLTGGEGISAGDCKGKIIIDGNSAAALGFGGAVLVLGRLLSRLVSHVQRRPHAWRSSLLRHVWKCRLGSAVVVDAAKRMFSAPTRARALCPRMLLRPLLRHRR